MSLGVLVSLAGPSFLWQNVSQIRKDEHMRKEIAMTAGAVALVVVAGCGTGGRGDTVASPQGSLPAVETVAIEAPAPDVSTAVESAPPAVSGPAELVGAKIGDPVPPGPPKGFDADGQIDPDLVPLWVAVSDANGVVIGFVRGVDLYNPDPPPPGTVLPPMQIFNDSGSKIGVFGDDGFPVIERWSG
jgi:hypothetical protein